MKVILIRHGATKGNLEKRYIGRTEEALCQKGIDMLSGKSFPDADKIYCSPQKRCIQTAKLIYPQKEIQSVSDFCECDFGLFEGKNYQELNGNKDYQRWIDSGGKTCFPGGEDPMEFRKRCVRAFVELMDREVEGGKVLAFVVHGGTIMSILEAYESGHEFYRWQCGNGCGYIVEWQDKKITVTEEI